MNTKKMNDFVDIYLFGIENFGILPKNCKNLHKIKMTTLKLLIKNSLILYKIYIKKEQTRIEKYIKVESTT